MKKSLYLCILILLIACTTKKEPLQNLEFIISQEEVRNFKEIERHSKLLIELHPELKPSTKTQLEQLITSALNRAQQLRNEESQIIKLLLDRSLRSKAESNDEKSTELELTKKLDKVYSDKEKNILTLVSRIKELSDNKEIDEKMEKDMMIFLRDFR